MFVQTIDIKVGKMRKPDNCVVYPNVTDNIAIVQGERLIMKVNLKTSKAICNYRCSGNYTGLHNLQAKNAIAVIVDAETIEKIKNAIPKSGDYVGSTVCTLA